MGMVLRSLGLGGNDAEFELEATEGLAGGDNLHARQDDSG